MNGSSITTMVDKQAEMHHLARINFLQIQLSKGGHDKKPAKKRGS
jgi:hypothetical protein